MTTTSGVPPWLLPPTKAAPNEVTALVIAWSSAEPHRMGEVLVVADGASPQLLGRGHAQLDDRFTRVAFVRQRPHASEPRGPLEAPGISRRHVVLTPRTGAVAFERLGRAPLLHNGVAVDRGVEQPGDTLAIDHQLLLYCTRRVSPLPAPRYLREAQCGAFGGPDEDGIVGESGAVWALREEIAFAAASRAHVLVLGASGTGKELVANAIHRWSNRGTKPLLARSAVSFPGTLIDAELFGNMRNYPNPGMAAREGLLGAADGTSLFLDEIGELPLDLQAHLLRVLDAGGHYHRLGESAARASDFRLIAATNRALGALKDDFAARFPLRIQVPSLDARREDVPLLCERLVASATATDPSMRRQFFGNGPHGPFCRFDPSFIDFLLRRPYELNVRELEGLLWASLRSSRGCLLQYPPGAGAARAESNRVAPPKGEPSADEIRAALERHRGNRSKAYLDLGLSSRYALRRLLRKHGLDDSDRD
jgi:two-component system nitrogen regulation response regulator GlnG/two-component system response regulator HydG